MLPDTCLLCSLPLPKKPIVEEERAFCCKGCHVVYQILTSKEISTDFQIDPLYHEAKEAGILSNPTLSEEKVLKTVTAQTQRVHLEIHNMWCPACAEAIRLILMRKNGVEKVVVDYATDLAIIDYVPRSIGKERIIQSIERLGYGCHSFLSQDSKGSSKSLWIRFAVSAFTSLNLMMFAWPLYASKQMEGYEELLGWLSCALSLPLLTFVAFPIWRRFFTAIRTAIFGMETLVLTGVLASFSYSTLHLLQHLPTQIYYDSMSMIITFVMLGRILEKRAKFSAKESLLRASRSFPKKGYRQMENGSYAYVPLKEVKIGDVLLSRTGEKIVLDGVVEKGEALVDEAVVTGEALPIQKMKNNTLISGSLVKQGALYYRVTADIEQSVFSKILTLVSGDLEQKKEGKRALDNITALFVPAVFICALLALPIGGVLRAISVLLISCPCAIGIAAPLAESLLLQCFVENGVLVRNRKALRLLGKDPLFVFDKTGTLTKGCFQLIRGLESLNPMQLSILKALTSSSLHPISAAIHETLPPTFVSLDNVHEVIGRGMEGEYQGSSYFLGSRDFLLRKKVQIPVSQNSLLESVVYFATGSKLLAILYLGDTLRENIPEVEGVVLSGDHSEVVSRLAKKYGFRWGKGDLTPAEKRQEIEKLKKEGRVVIMIGDGVNDAPALAAADVGISVATGTDVSIEVSDMLLTTNRFELLPQLCVWAKQGQKIIRQNFFWAFGYNTIGIGLALGGFLTPLLAAFLMVLSSLFVILNSLRILTISKK